MSMKNQCGMSNVEGQIPPARFSAERTLPIHHSLFPIRSGVTLIELLITMTIMAIIAAAILGTAAAAIEGAREKRTQSLITKIHTLLMEHLSTYETRRVEISRAHLDALEQRLQLGQITPTERGQMLADLRLLGLRELMKYEMPDRWSDALGTELGNTPVVPVFLAARPPLAEAYIRRSLTATADNQGAECLYLTIMSATGDGEARTLFSKQDIGDTDSDGAPEFVDAWGNPIEYLRWAPGFASRSQLMTGDGNGDHDPFDVYRRDDPNAVPVSTARYAGILVNYVASLKDQHLAFRLVPLVFSAGPDGEYDIITAREKVVSRVGTNEVGLNPFYVDTALTPPVVGGTPYGFGMPLLTDDADTTKDHITNHLIEY
jgi:prepilin-type N-terminal cleavage/methylation domain-containing protein